VRSLTFHSLRHTATSWLANEGVPDDVRMKLVGHSDKAVHAKYSHHDERALREAIGKLPKLNISWWFFKPFFVSKLPSVLFALWTPNLLTLIHLFPNMFFNNFCHSLDGTYLLDTMMLNEFTKHSHTS